MTNACFYVARNDDDIAERFGERQTNCKQPSIYHNEDFFRLQLKINHLNVQTFWNRRRVSLYQQSAHNTMDFVWFI